MNKQMTLSCFCDELAQTKTSKKAFLKQMKQIIPWNEWIGIIKPCYYKGERGNKPYDLELMLRIYIFGILRSRFVKPGSRWRHYRKISQHTSEKWHTRKVIFTGSRITTPKRLDPEERTNCRFNDYSSPIIYQK